MESVHRSPRATMASPHEPSTSARGFFFPLIDSFIYIFSFSLCLLSHRSFVHPSITSIHPSQPPLSFSPSLPDDTPLHSFHDENRVRFPGTDLRSTLGCPATRIRSSLLGLVTPETSESDRSFGIRCSPDTASRTSFHRGIVISIVSIIVILCFVFCPWSQQRSRCVCCCCCCCG